MKNIQLTKTGFEKLKQELEELKTKTRDEVLKRLNQARSMGDLSENSAYSSAKEELNLVEGRIAELEEILKNAKIVEEIKDKTTVQVGSSVVVEINGKKEKFEIVGEFEADPLNKKLSHTSPIGKALVGKKIGEWVEVEVPAGKIRYKIVEIQ
jgi:transcription elongation factor GreA